MTASRLRLNLAGRSYDIVVGANILQAAGQEAARLRKFRRTFIVTDETVARAHLGTLTRSFDAVGISHTSTVLPPGEGTKSFAMLELLINRMLDANLERSDLIVALGGGVIGDLSGFAAGILKRGLDYVQIPTTLLAQVDSSVGGKTAIDMPQGKNLVGVFHQPVLVLADTQVLTTLPVRELRAGFAEILKYGLISDANFAEWLATNTQPILNEVSAERTQAILTSCKMKAAIVEQDEREQGARALLNLGHTFGHAVEAFAGFSGKILHGESVALGCCLAFDYSAEHGLLPHSDAAKVRTWFARAGLPATFNDIPDLGATARDLIELMKQDKKSSGGQLVLILARGIGQAFIANNVDDATMLAFLQRKLEQTQLH